MRLKSCFTHVGLLSYNGNSPTTCSQRCLRVPACRKNFGRGMRHSCLPKRSQRRRVWATRVESGLSGPGYAPPGPPFCPVNSGRNHHDIEEPGPLTCIPLITPGYAAIWVYYFNHKVLTRYLISLDDGT